MKQIFHGMLGGLLAIGWILGSFSICVAETGQVRPYVEVRHEYSDNILFSADNEEEDMITTAAAGLLLAHRGERTTAKLDSRLHHYFYWDNDQLDDTNGRIRADLQHQMTELVQIGLNGDYQKESQRGSGTDETGLSLTGDRDSYNIGASTTFTLSEIHSLTLSAGYGKETTDQTNTEDDDQSIRAELSLNRNMSRLFPNTIGFLNFSYLRYDAEQASYSPGAFIDATYSDVTSDVAQFYIGFSRDVTELVSIYLQAGASYVKSSEKQSGRSGFTGAVGLLRPEEKSEAFGGVLAAGVNYNGLYWNLGLSASHDIRGAAGSNGTVERTSLRGDISRQVTDHLSLYLNTSAYLNRNERKTQSDLDTLTCNIEPGLRYRFLDTFSVTLAGRYTNVDDREADSTKERILAYVMIRKVFDL